MQPNMKGEEAKESVQYLIFSGRDNSVSLVSELKKKELKEAKAKQMMMMKEFLLGVLPFVAMVALEVGSMVSLTICKAAMNNGLSSFVYTVYHNALGTLIFLPFFIHHRHRNKGPSASPSLLARFFLLGLLGISIVPVFGNLGIKYGSPTLAAALGNLIPGFTFLIAVLFRMEKVAVRSKVSQAKIIGTIVSISGAFIVTFYKGPPILMALSQKSNWALGGVLLTITCLSSSTWSVFQAVVLKDHPDKMTLIFFSCLFGSIQCAVISMVAESDLSAWTLHSRIEVTAVLYGTIMDTVLRNSICAWVLHKKGPVYVALFNPLGTAVAVILGVLFLGETPHVGSLVGAVVVSVGFYAVIWGQDKEQDIADGKVCISESSSSSSAQKVPLLQPA